MKIFARVLEKSNSLEVFWSLLQMNRIVLLQSICEKLLIIEGDRLTNFKFLAGADERAQKEQKGGEEEARGGGEAGGLRRLGRHGRHDGILGIRGLQKELRSRLIGN